MEVDTISWIKFQVKKYIRYVYLVLLVVSFSFPINPPHSTFNFIEILRLPDFAYPISYFMIGVFFILLVSKFSVPKVEKKKIYFDQSTKKMIEGDIQTDLSGIEASFEKRTLGGAIDNKNIWKVHISKPVKKSFNVLLNYQDKHQLEKILQTFKN